MSDPAVQHSVSPAFKCPQCRPPVGALAHLEGIHRQSLHPSDLFHYGCGLLYEISSRIDDAEAMYKKAAALEMNDIFLKAISSVRQAKEDQKKLAGQQRGGNPLSSTVCRDV